VLVQAKYETPDIGVVVSIDTSTTPNQFRVSLVRGNAFPEGFEAVLSSAARTARSNEAASPEELFDAFLAGLKENGLVFERIPDSGMTIQVKLDLETGRTETVSTPLQGAPPPSDRFMARLARVTREAIRNAVETNPEQLQKALASGNAAEFLGALSLCPIEDGDKRKLVVELSQQALARGDWSEHHQSIALVTAHICRQANDTTAARTLLRRIIDGKDSTDKLQITLQLELANTYATEERFDPAIEIYRGLLEAKVDVDKKTWAWIHHNLGMVLTKKGDIAAGLPLLREAGRIRKDAGEPDEPWRTLGTAASAIERHHLREAISLYDEIAQGLEEAKEPTLLRIRGHVLFAAARLWCNEFERHEYALERLRKMEGALAQFHEDEETLASAMMLEAICHQALGNSEAAETAKGKRRDFIERRPHLLSAQLEKLLADPTAALAEASVTNPAPSQLVELLRDMETLKGLSESSMADKLEAMVESVRSWRNHDSPALEALLLEYGGIVLAERGRKERALQFFLRAVAAHPGSLDRRTRLAMHLHNMSRIPEAIEVARTIARDNPDSHIGFLLAGAAAYRGADYRLAETMLGQALTLSPGDAIASELLEKTKKESLHRVLQAVPSEIPLTGESAPTTHGAFLAYLRGFTTRARLNAESFWKAHSKGKLVENPENAGRALFAQDLVATCRSAAIYKETILPGGRIDLVANILGTEFIVELKICGPGYSKAYAEGGFDQLRKYLAAREQTRGYLVVFDGRADQDGPAGIPDKVDLGDGLLVFCVVVNIRGT
jgi:tetratricopeptide (TPR) repeat protein